MKRSAKTGIERRGGGRVRPPVGNCGGRLRRIQFQRAAAGDIGRPQAGSRRDISGVVQIQAGPAVDRISAGANYTVGQAVAQLHRAAIDDRAARVGVRSQQRQRAGIGLDDLRSPADAARAGKDVIAGAVDIHDAGRDVRAQVHHKTVRRVIKANNAAIQVTDRCAAAGELPILDAGKVPVIGGRTVPHQRVGGQHHQVNLRAGIGNIARNKGRQRAGHKFARATDATVISKQRVRRGRNQRERARNVDDVSAIDGQTAISGHVAIHPGAVGAQCQLRHVG